MKAFEIRTFLIGVIFFAAGCANITAPTGGKKDIIPPKLVAVDPLDSQLNARIKRVDMTFDEYVTLSDATKEVELSPILSVQPVVSSINKKVTIKIVDSLLEDNTTYRLSFGKAIKDLHEGNAFTKYVYTFSTGPYFDSLELEGSVIDAATGLVDTGNVFVELYSAKENDSAVVRHKPKYIIKAGAQGNFSFKGLPKRSFRIYAVKDVNGNLIYDGPSGGEKIAFIDQAVMPGDSAMPPIMLRMFKETIDTSIKENTDTAAIGLKGKKKQTVNLPIYSVNVDTTTPGKRTFDVNNQINIVFRDLPTINKDKITLAYDSAGVTVKPPVSIYTDSPNSKVFHIATQWAEDMVYTLRLVKGFAKDTAGKDLPPSRYTFRTKEDEDYSKITVHVPTRYYGNNYVLVILADKDTFYQKPVTDSIVNLVKLKPGIYTFRIIIDKNGNGKWDTGDLLGKKQPEEVVPYMDQVTLKAGWENIVDFEEKKPDKKVPKKGGLKNNLPPKK